MDFLISNILCYFEKLSEKFPETKEKLLEEIEENGSRVLSEMLKTGVTEIDDKFLSESENLNLLGGQLNLKLLSGFVPDPFGLLPYYLDFNFLRKSKWNEVFRFAFTVKKILNYLPN